MPQSVSGATWSETIEESKAYCLGALRLALHWHSSREALLREQWEDSTDDK